MSTNRIQFTRIKNNVYGNPRYVCHFLNLCSPQEMASREPASYEAALSRAKQIGGRKFHNRQYGGGIVFVSYSLEETVNAINRVSGQSHSGYYID